ncbi:DUF4133 domain-containing protein [Chitinophaga lutea]|uniref:DUF4133 domain-containing protein n=1 Tax=Chitinophaga lutea TaxID=2488634 RepID=A0A3N4QB14_9BACT|nr:DUF4133 domain-containing protein [Chitinophaga lutea]RPE13177.1 DUF4133 domain-containing protein [Chitinophaga lutea]
MSSVFRINKGIGKSIEFRGIKAQFLYYLAAGMLLLLLVFFGLYALGINMYLCVGITLPAGAGLIALTQHLSKKYGAHGLTKRLQQHQLPETIYSRSRKVFTQLKRSHP